MKSLYDTIADLDNRNRFFEWCGICVTDDYIKSHRPKHCELCGESMPVDRDKFCKLCHRKLMDESIRQDTLPDVEYEDEGGEEE